MKYETLRTDCYSGQIVGFINLDTHVMIRGELDLVN